MHVLARGCPLLLLAALLVAGCGSGTKVPLTPRLVVYNSSADLLAGDLWDATRRDRAARDLRDVPPGWLLVGLGTTANDQRNGEVIVRGTAGGPEWLWCDPDAQGLATSLDNQPLPFLALGLGDPARALRINVPADTDLDEAVRDAVRAAGFPLAGVTVEARLSDVVCSVAYNLPKEGTPLGANDTVPGAYLRPVLVEAEADWWAGGLYAAGTADRALINRPGEIVALRGLTGSPARGGVIEAATVVSGTVTVWPLETRLRRQADLVAETVEVFGDVISFRVRNAGENETLRTPYAVRAGTTVLHTGDLGGLPAGSARTGQIITTANVSPTMVRVVVDPDEEITESDETNNTAPRGAS